MSNIESPTTTRRKEYEEWFDKWVYKYYELPKSKDPLLNMGAEATKFDGKNCYALRCALLHTGNTDLIKNHGRIDIFELCISDVSSHCGDASVCNISKDGTNNVYVSLNVVGLIEAIVDGATEFISKNKNKIQEHEKTNSEKAYGSIVIKAV